FLGTVTFMRQPHTIPLSPCSNYCMCGDWGLCVTCCCHWMLLVYVQEKGEIIRCASRKVKLRSE
ncbi:hypothetical protein E2562_033894, partial [Oryza meyeriana var. granulata]